MKIYTKIGDKGTTQLVDGECVEKFNPRVEAYGTIDELNSQIGLLVSEMMSQPASFPILTSELQRIQHWLFNAGSLVATQNEQVRSRLPKIVNAQIEFLENRIDQMTNELPVLKNFILPGGHKTSSLAHLCRTFCRRAERRIAEVMQKDDGLSDTLVFLNRLSDYFFTLARFLNLKTGTAEIVWNKDSSV